MTKNNGFEKSIRFKRFRKAEMKILEATDNG